MAISETFALVRVFPPVVAIFIISFFISLIVTLVYKFTTNQEFMKTLHADMKSLRGEIKNTKETSEATALNKRLMEKTMQQVMHSMKSTFITIIPIFLIFGWMGGHLAFIQAAPGEQFTTSILFDPDTEGNASITADTLNVLSEPTQSIEDNMVKWKLNGQEGTHAILYSFNDETYQREVILSNKWEYADPYLEKKRSFLGIINIGDKQPVSEDSAITRVAVDLQSVRPFGNLRLFGWQPGWLATYFFFTLVLTFPMRRLFKVH